MAACDRDVRGCRRTGGAMVRAELPARKHTCAARSRQPLLRASGRCCLVSAFKIRGRNRLAALKEEWKVRRTG